MKANQMPDPKFNIDTIRKNALRSMDKGAVTADYPLDAKEACKLLNEALAGEIICVLRYRHQQLSVKGVDFPQVAAKFREHAEEEEMHVTKLSERINQLGGEANFDPHNFMIHSPVEYTQSKNIMSMIQDSLVAERIGIEIYRKLIPWFGAGDTTTRRMLESILADEEEHAANMSDLLDEVGSSGAHADA